MWARPAPRRCRRRRRTPACFSWLALLFFLLDSAWQLSVAAATGQARQNSDPASIDGWDLRGIDGWAVAFAIVLLKSLAVVVLIPQGTPRLIFHVYHVLMFLGVQYTSVADGLNQNEGLLKAIAMLFGVNVSYAIEFSRRRAHAKFVMTNAQLEVAAELAAQEDIAAYAFHELRNDLNATVGLMQCIDQSVEAGECAMATVAPPPCHHRGICRCSSALCRPPPSPPKTDCLT